MPDSILCPMCQADIVLDEAQARALCSDCHDLDDSQLAAELQKRVDRALWLAVRAVEDQAAYVRWLRKQGKSAPPDAEDSEQASELLRSVLRANADR